MIEFLLRSSKTYREYQACAHVWLDVTTVHHRLNVPICGEPTWGQWPDMTKGHTYECRHCGTLVMIRDESYES